MSYEKLGFTSGQVLKADHLNHIENGFLNISWNDLKDKPFYEENTVLATLTRDMAVDGLWILEDFPLIEGRTYHLVADGGEQQYSAICQFDERIGAVSIVFFYHMSHLGLPNAIWISRIPEFEQPVLQWLIATDYGHNTIPIPDTMVISSPTVKTIDTKYLPEALQIGVTTEIVEIVPEQSVESEGGDGGYHSRTNITFDGDFNGNLDVTATYIVYLNGNEYACTPRMDNIMDGSSLILGNPHLFSGMFDGSYVENENTGEPFAFLPDLYWGGQLRWSTDFGETITFRVVEQQEKVEYLDNKFVQNSTVTAYLTGEWDEEYEQYRWTVDKSYEELRKAYESGKTLRLLRGDVDDDYGWYGQVFYLTEVGTVGLGFIGTDGYSLMIASVGAEGVNVEARELLFAET